MKVFVLDSSAVLRFIDNEAGADRVREILQALVNGSAGVCISAVQWGEVAGNLRSRLGPRQESRILSSLLPREAEIIPASAERAAHAAELRIDHKISYADAFAFQLALDSPDHVLVTADHDFQPMAYLANVEFLPEK